MAYEDSCFISSKRVVQIFEGQECPTRDHASEDKDDLLEKTYSQVLLFFSNGVLRKVTQEKYVTGLWQKLDNLYIIKSLTNRFGCSLYKCRKVRLLQTILIHSIKLLWI